MGFYGILWDILMYPLVSSNTAGWNIPCKWRSQFRKSTDFSGPFSSTPCLITGWYGIFTNIDLINDPVMYVNIPAPWSIWVWKTLETHIFQWVDRQKSSVHVVWSIVKGELSRPAANFRARSTYGNLSELVYVRFCENEGSMINYVYSFHQIPCYFEWWSHFTYIFPSDTLR